MNRLAKLLTSMLALSALATGCSAVETNGPLRAGGDQSDLCTPAPPEGFAAVGDVVTNDGDGDLVLTGLELVGSTSIKHEGSYVMLIEGATDASSGVVLGTASTVTDDPLQVAAWERREKLSSFTLAPGETANVIVTLSLPTPEIDGKAEAIRIAYSDGTRKFTAETSMKITLTGEEACA